MSEERWERVTIRIDGKLSRTSDADNEQRIFRVHQTLRSQNEEAYEPRILSIGPYHRGKSHLAEAEAYKLRYLSEHLTRKGSAGNRDGKLSAGNYVRAFSKFEKQARAYYSKEDMDGLEGDEFVEMLFVDGCFIVEFLRRFHGASVTFTVHSPERGDPIFGKDWLAGYVIRDLILFENQLPFFVLTELFEMTKLPTCQEENLYELAFSAFSQLFPGENPEHLTFDPIDDGKEVNHFLDLIYRQWCSAFVKNVNDEKKGEEKKTSLASELEHIKSASELKRTGIKFERASKETSWLDITYQNGVISIPSLRVADTTECVLRNLIAYEQYTLQPTNRKCLTDYITFMDCLVDTSKDVEMLRHCQIIGKWVGDDEAISSMINKLGSEVAIDDSKFCYLRVFKQVNEDSSRRWNAWRAHLMRNYFGNPWSVISFVAALLLLLFTTTQTLFSVLQYSE